MKTSLAIRPTRGLTWKKLPSPRKLRSTSGFSLLELLITMGVIMVSLLGYLRAMTESVELSELNRERILAGAAARQVLEDMQGRDFADVFAEYNSVAADDPGGAGTGFGNAFDVASLTPLNDDADGSVGEIVFPTSGPGVLCEAPAVEFPLMPRDLNLDGDATDNDVTAGHALLPVCVRVRWGGSRTPRTLQLVTLLTDRSAP